MLNEKELEKLEYEIDYICFVLGVNTPKIIVTDNQEHFVTDTTFAALNYKTKQVYIYRDMMNDLMSTIFFVAHELRHLWQIENDKVNLTDYKQSDEVDLDTYYLQECEIDANAFAVAYMRKYFKRDMKLTVISDKILDETIKRAENIDLTLSFKKMRNRTGLSQEKIRKYLKIPLRTIENWEMGQRTAPNYLLELIEYKLLHEGLI